MYILDQGSHTMYIYIYIYIYILINVGKDLWSYGSETTHGVNKTHRKNNNLLIMIKKNKKKQI